MLQFDYTPTTLAKLVALSFVRKHTTRRQWHTLAQLPAPLKNFPAIWQKPQEELEELYENLEGALAVSPLRRRRERETFLRHAHEVAATEALRLLSQNPKKWPSSVVGVGNRDGDILGWDTAFDVVQQADVPLLNDLANMEVTWSHGHDPWLAIKHKHPEFCEFVSERLDEFGGDLSTEEISAFYDAVLDGAKVHAIRKLAAKTGTSKHKNQAALSIQIGRASCRERV